MHNPNEYCCVTGDVAGGTEVFILPRTGRSSAQPVAEGIIVSKDVCRDQLLIPELKRNRVLVQVSKILVPAAVVSVKIDGIKKSV